MSSCASLSGTIASWSNFHFINLCLLTCTTFNHRSKARHYVFVGNILKPRCFGSLYLICNFFFFFWSWFVTYTLRLTSCYLLGLWTLIHLGCIFSQVQFYIVVKPLNASFLDPTLNKKLSLYTKIPVFALLPFKTIPNQLIWQDLLWPTLQSWLISKRRHLPGCSV